MDLVCWNKSDWLINWFIEDNESNDNENREHTSYCQQRRLARMKRRNKQRTVQLELRFHYNTEQQLKRLGLTRLYRKRDSSDLGPAGETYKSY